MNTYKGQINIRLMNKGSKSEGEYAFLQTDQAEYRLIQDGENLINVTEFLEFNGKEVVVEGSVIDNRWLLVDKVYLLTYISENRVTETVTVAETEINDDEEM